MRCAPPPATWAFRVDFLAPAGRLSPAPDTPQRSPWYYITGTFGFPLARLSVVSFALLRLRQCG